MIDEITEELEKIEDISGDGMPEDIQGAVSQRRAQLNAQLDKIEEQSIGKAKKIVSED